MIDDESLHQLIDEYLNGNLKGEEKENFEKKIHADSQLAAQVALHRELDHFILNKEERAVQDNLKKIHEQNSYQIPKKKRSIRPMYFVLGAIAACLLFFLLRPILFTNPTLNTIQLFDKYAIHDPISIIEKGENRTNLALVENKFNQGDFELATQLFDTLIDQNPKAFDLYLFDGIAHLQLDQYPAALARFNTILESDALVEEDALWYKGLTFLKQNAVEEAKKIFIQISKEPNNAYQQKAQNLLADWK